MLKRTMSVIIALVMLLALFTGCGENAPAPSDSSRAETASASEQGTTAEEVQKYSGEIVISIVSDVPHKEDAMKSVVEEYNKHQPDVKVIWEPKAAQDYDTWLSTQLASGDLRADVVSGNLAKTYGNYVDFNKYRGTENPYTGNVWEEDYDFDFSNELNAKSQKYFIPTQSVHIMWFYNKDIFEKVGVTPPKTWSEFEQVCEKLQGAGYLPITTQYSWKLNSWVPEIYLDQYSRSWNEIVKAQPGDYCYVDKMDGKFEYDPQSPYLGNDYTFNSVRYYKALKEKQIRFDTPETADMMKNFSKILLKYANQDALVNNVDYAMFLRQDAAMFISGTWDLLNLSKDMKNLNDAERLKQLKISSDTALKAFNWSTFENPSMEGPLVQGTARSIESSGGEYISIVDKNQEKTDMVVDFIKFWISPIGYEIFINSQAAHPNGVSVSGPLMIKGVKLPPELEEMFGNVQMLGNAEYMLNYFVSNPGGNGTVSKQSQDLFAEVLMGKITPEEFGPAFQKLIDDNFETILEAAGLTLDDLEHPEKQPDTK